ncbi:hypothetical protein C8R44DRAFT_899670 [Mycena epipterygia]|nr:hypothetical protein C8R44DRAFT_899670 [Mycena epipterygia]
MPRLFGPVWLRHWRVTSWVFLSFLPLKWPVAALSRVPIAASGWLAPPLCSRFLFPSLPAVPFPFPAHFRFPTPTSPPPRDLTRPDPATTTLDTVQNLKGYVVLFCGRDPDADPTADELDARAAAQAQADLDPAATDSCRVPHSQFLPAPSTPSSPRKRARRSTGCGARVHTTAVVARHWRANVADASSTVIPLDLRVRDTWCGMHDLRKRVGLAEYTVRGARRGERVGSDAVRVPARGRVATHPWRADASPPGLPRPSLAFASTPSPRSNSNSARGTRPAGNPAPGLGMTICLSSCSDDTRIRPLPDSDSSSHSTRTRVGTQHNPGRGLGLAGRVQTWGFQIWDSTGGVGLVLTAGGEWYSCT